MALKITATVVVKRRVLADEGVTVPKDNGSTARAWAAHRVWLFLARTLPSAFVEGLVVTVEEVDKKGDSKGLLVGTSDGSTFPDANAAGLGF